MSLKETLMEDLKDSMRNKNKIQKNTITMVRAAIKQIEVDERRELTDEDIIEVMAKELKERKVSIEEFKKGNRPDLVEEVEEEIQVLLKYMPKQLSEDELRDLVSKSIEAVGATSMRDIGKIMKDIMPKVKGMADGNSINKLIKEYFNNLV